MYVRHDVDSVLLECALQHGAFAVEEFVKVDIVYPSREARVDERNDAVEKAGGGGAGATGEATRGSR